MTTVKRLISNIFFKIEGQALTEYGLIALFLSIIAIISIAESGESVRTLWENIQNTITQAFIN